MDKTNRIAYPWEVPDGTQLPDSDRARGCEHPLEDSLTYPPGECQGPSAASASHYEPLSHPKTAPHPESPAYVLAHAFRENQVTLLWGKAEGAEGYLLLRGEHPGTLKPVAAVEEASYIDTQVRPGQTYYYTVRAYNEHGQSTAAPPAAVTLPDAPAAEPPPAREHTPPDASAQPLPESAPPPFAGKRLRVQRKKAQLPAKPDVPAAPANLRAKVSGTHLVELSWEGSAQPEAPEEDMEYRVYRSAAPWSGYGLIAETQACSYHDTVPDSGAKYYYFVQAVEDGRASQASAMAEAMTFPALPPPEPPEHLRAVPVQPDAIELRWNHARGAAAYAVYARTQDGEFRVIGHTLYSGFLHENLPEETSFDYRVQAYHDTGVSEPSAICAARTGASRTSRQAPRSAPPAQNRRFPAFSLQNFRN